MKNDKLMVILVKSNPDIKEYEVINATFNSKDFYSLDALAKFVSYMYGASVLIKDLSDDIVANDILQSVSLEYLFDLSFDIINNKLATNYNAKKLPADLDRKILRQFVELMEKQEKPDMKLISVIKNNYLND